MYFWLDLEEPGAHGLLFQKVLRCQNKGTVHHDARTPLVTGLWAHRTDVNPVNRVLDHKNPTKFAFAKRAADVKVGTVPFSRGAGS